MLKKLFGLDNDSISSLVRHVLSVVGTFLATLGLVGADDWTFISGQIDSIIGAGLALWAAVQGWLTKDKEPTPTA